MNKTALAPKPALLISFELEAAPRLIGAWTTDREEAMLLDWLFAHPNYREIIDRAAELVTERAA